MDADSFTSLEGMQEDGGSPRSDSFDELILILLSTKFVFHIFYHCDVFCSVQGSFEPFITFFWNLFFFLFLMKNHQRRPSANVNCCIVTYFEPDAFC